MSILGSIISKVFEATRHNSGAQSQSATEAPRPGQPQQQQAAAQPQQQQAATPISRQSGSTQPSSPPPTAKQQESQADVEAGLNGLAAKKHERLDWRESIVDLMKLLDLDSSLAARKQLAQELGYAKDTSDTVAMNMWLHKEVMQKLAENGGKVPPDLLKH
jgi:hypothetical protein